ncbi:MAG: AAA-like domain-containing protein [Anaerolineae bacterium]
MRFFNTAGPVNCEDHYCLPPLERFDLADILSLIEQKKYFVLHAPRQTGKTSALLALMEHLNRRGPYRALYANLEVGQSAREDIAAAMRAIVNEIASRARDFLDEPFLKTIAQEVLQESGPHSALGEILTRWAERSMQPLVLLLDEVDALVGDTLIAVLRQLRAGYDKRPSHFPSTVVLCGVRDVRDYRIHSSQSQTIITGGSAFNIKAVSLRLGDFTQPEVERLLLQHTAETGQVFEADTLATVWALTRGQPWLVNALAYETTFTMHAGRDRIQPITAEMIQEAKENLILRRETHLDQLTDKLREPRVRRVIEALLVSGETPLELPDDDLQYVADLGLIRRTPNVVIANPIYREIIPRALTSVTQDFIVQELAWYIRSDGQLDLPKLLAAFQQFFREHSESWVERFDYKEAGPQLLLQAFLQRIVNGGGRVEREYGLGRKRTDLLVLWPVAEPGVEGKEHVQRGVIELKVLHKSLEATLAEGVVQTWEYADRCGAAEAHLVIFDRTPDKPWEEKIFRREEAIQGRPITVWGM